MNDEGITKTENVARNFINWLVYAVVFFVILGGFLWVLLYSTYFANLSFVIPIRNFYQDTYWKVGGLILGNKTYPPLGPIYTIQPQKSQKVGLNTYTLIGTFSKLDMDNGLIFLKANNGKVYPFDINSSLYVDQDIWLKTIYVSSLNRLSTLILPNNLYKPAVNNTTPVSTQGALFKVAIPPINKVVLSGSQILIKDNTLSSKLGTLGVRWNDKRSSSQIEKDYSNGPNIPLNDEYPDSLILAEFKQ